MPTGPAGGSPLEVIVTGGAGFIGSNLVRALVERGDRVVVIDNLAATWSFGLLEDLAGRIELIHGDIRLAEDLERVGGGPYDRVYHLAASFANELSMEHPAIDMRSNIEGTLNVLAMARRVGCGLFVYTGSSSSYGDVPVPFAEDGPARPYTPYAISKHVGETYVRSFGLPYAVFRLFNVYGPGDPPGRYRNAVPNMMQALTRGEGTIRIFGTDATRDFTYVGDVVRVLLEAPRALGQTVNLGSGREIAIVDLARTILGQFGLPETRLVFEERRSWDRVIRRCAAVDRLRDLFGWVPDTPLEDGLRRAAQWLRAAGHLGPRKHEAA
ncbi:MAG TPA: NAD-dependent epimerase/dehydratase family protein [Terriglobales bacterium]|nr:NAD-dependent epimerase/dehydratase family protein [Terriglobales bacterium]